MASAAATVLFRRPGRMSRRAELTGSFVGAGVVCAAAEAASNSKAGITRVVFILSSSFFGESGGLPQPQFPGHQPSSFTTISLNTYNNFISKQFHETIHSPELFCIHSGPLWLCFETRCYRLLSWPLLLPRRLYLNPPCFYKCSRESHWAD